MTRHSVLRRVGLTGLAIALLVGWAFDRPARTAGGTTIHVTTAVEGLADDGQCSLAEAIYSANLDAGLAPAGYAGGATFYTSGCEAGSGDDVIELQAGTTYQFSAPLHDPINPYGPTATPVVFSKIVIEGNGATLLRPNPARDFSGTNFRAFAVGTYGVFGSGQRLLTIPGDGNGQLTLRNALVKGFTARGGNGAHGGGGGLGAGGAVFVHRGTLVVESSTFVDNGAAGGNGAVAAHSAGGGGGGMGGNGAPHGPGSSLFGGGGGGGAQFDGGVGGHDTFAGGGGGGGGGTYQPGRGGWDEDLHDFALTGGGGFQCGGDGGNTDIGDGGDDGDAGCAGGGGGGGESYRPVLGVIARGHGGHGGFGGGGGGGGYDNGDGGNGGFGGGGGGAETYFCNASDATFPQGGHGGFGGGGGAAYNCAIVSGPGEGGAFGGNAQSNGGGGGAGLGGAIFNYGGVVRVRNSTFNGNFAVRGMEASNGGGVRGHGIGSAVFSVNGGVQVLNSTIAGNESTSDGALVMFKDSDSTVAAALEIRNTIVSTSYPLTAQSCYTLQAPLDNPLLNNISLITSTGSGNVIQSNGNCVGNNTSTPGDPLLGALTVNKPGLTPTMALAPESPAVDAGDNAYCTATDQRGVSRSQAQPCDIGAYEYVAPSANLSVAKTLLSTPIAGADVSYAIDVLNNGPTDAEAVTLSDTLPAGTTFVSMTGSAGFTCSGTTTVTCTAASMVSGQMAKFTLTVHLPSSATAGSTITNTTSVTSSTDDPEPGNNSSSASGTVVRVADVNVSKSLNGTPIAGADVNYTLVAANAGPSDASTLSLADTVPAGTTFKSLTAPSGWTCTTPTVGGTGAISCSRSTLTAGASASFTLVTRLASSAAEGSTLCNTATLSTTTNDPTSANNTSQACGVVRTLADIGLAQTAAITGSAGKGTASFSLTARNNGPSDSRNVAIVATSNFFVGPPAPAITASPGASCSVAGTTVTCRWATVTAGEVKSVKIDVPWKSAVGQVCDTASATAGTSDPDATNNASALCTSKK